MWKFYYVIFRNLFRIPFIIWKMRYEAKHPEKYSELDQYHMVQYVAWLIKTTGKIETKAYGLENLPKEGGYVMYPNHQGKYDALGIMLTHDSPCSIVMDEKRSHMPLVTEVIDLVKGKRMDKEDIRQSLRIINEMTEEVKQGRRYMIFPEGGYEFNNQNQVETFKAGSFKCAVNAKAPIVPVALVDSYKAFNSYEKGAVTTQVHYLKPLYYEEYQGLKTIEIAKIVQDRIAAVLKENSES